MSLTMPRLSRVSELMIVGALVFSAEPILGDFLSTHNLVVRLNPTRELEMVIFGAFVGLFSAFAHAKRDQTRDVQSASTRTRIVGLVMFGASFLFALQIFLTAIENHTLAVNIGSALRSAALGAFCGLIIALWGRSKNAGRGT